MGSNLPVTKIKLKNLQPKSCVYLKLLLSLQPEH
jgi:hypothetical protein